MRNIAQEVRKIWSEFFGMEITSDDTDFFEIGGDSILGYRVINKINETFSIEIDISEFLKASTVSDTIKLVKSKLA